MQVGSNGAFPVFHAGGDLSEDHVLFAKASVALCNIGKWLRVVIQNHTLSFRHRWHGNERYSFCMIRWSGISRIHLTHLRERNRLPSTRQVAHAISSAGVASSSVKASISSSAFLRWETIAAASSSG